MKRGKRIAYVLLAAVLLTVSALPPMETKAGRVEMLLDEDTLDASNWNNPEGDVVVKENTLVFPKESTEYTRYITKSPAKIDRNAMALIKVSADAKLNSIPQGGSFILAFGLSGIEAEQGDEGNIEVSFTNDGGIKTSVNYYDGENTEIVAAPVSSGLSLGKTSEIAVEITTDSEIKVTVNGSIICRANLPVSGEGRFGFLQTGGCSVEIADLEVVHYKYDRPENTNVSENFEEGAMDTSKLTAKMIGSYYCKERGQSVQDYDGNQVLMFRNVGVSYVGTMCQYSNFEMTFDVPYINTTPKYGEDGVLAEAPTRQIIVTLGGERADWDSEKWEMAAEAIVFSENTVYAMSNEEAKVSVPIDKPFSAKVSMIDGIVTVETKSMEEQNYKPVLQYKLKGGTPSGHIHIWTKAPGNFAVDNLFITNKDDSPNLIETEPVSGKIVAPPDNQLEPMKRVYMKEEESEFSWYLLIPAAAVVGLGALVVTAIVSGRKKEEREANKDE